MGFFVGGPLPTHSSVHRSALENPQKLGGVGGGGNGIGVRAPMYSMTSPMPQKSLISDNKSKPPNNQQPRPNHHQQYQQPSQNDTVHYQHQKQLSAEERVPAAPHPARRQFTSSFQPSPQQTAQTSSAFRRPNSNGPPAYESLREPATAGRQSTNGMVGRFANVFTERFSRILWIADIEYMVFAFRRLFDTFSVFNPPVNLMPKISNFENCTYFVTVVTVTTLQFNIPVTFWAFELSNRRSGLFRFFHLSFLLHARDCFEHQRKKAFL